MRKTKLYVLLIAIIGCYSANLKSQVTIGSLDNPHGGAVLDLQSSNRGLKLPSVELSNVNTYGLVEGTASSAAGMIVYNINPNIVGGSGIGIYYWDGSKWLTVDSSASLAASITGLSCSSVSIVNDQRLTDGDTAYETIVRVPYTGGNGGIYSEGPVISCEQGVGYIGGLKMQLQAGRLAVGAGELIYKVWADPAIIGSSPDIAKFNISFPTESGNLSCTVEVGNTGRAATESYAVVGPLVPTKPATENNVPGYERVITTPDGRWSVRAFIPKASVNYSNYGGSGTSPKSIPFTEVDINIRANNMTSARTIMWAAHVVYHGGDYSGTNFLEIPLNASNIWGGTNHGVGDEGKNDGPDFWRIYPTTSKSNDRSYQVAWANSNVYQGKYPEKRTYTWTEIGSTGARTVYAVNFMMGVDGEKYATDATVKESTVYLKVEQYSSDE